MQQTVSICYRSAQIIPPSFKKNQKDISYFTFYFSHLLVVFFTKIYLKARIIDYPTTLPLTYNKVFGASVFICNFIRMCYLKLAYNKV